MTPARDPKQEGNLYSYVPVVLSSEAFISQRLSSAVSFFRSASSDPLRNASQIRLLPLQATLSAESQRQLTAFGYGNVYFRRRRRTAPSHRAVASKVNVGKSSILAPHGKVNADKSSILAPHGKLNVDKSSILAPHGKVNVDKSSILAPHGTVSVKECSGSTSRVF